MYAYNLSFSGQQYNYSATVAIVMGVITAVIAYVVQLRGMREEADDQCHADRGRRTSPSCDGTPHALARPRAARC